MVGKLFGILVALATCLSVANACKGAWANDCNDQNPCCAGLYCDRPSHWRHGVCKSGGGGGNGNGGGNGGNGGNAPTASRAEFNNAVTSNRYPAPSDAQYYGFLNAIPKGGITSKTELAMALAQFIHESGGLQHKRELACLRPDNYNCPRDYKERCDVGGQHYFGRGYIQLSWCYNYRQIGQDLGRGDELLYNADLVAQNEQIAWDTAFAFWKRHVHPNGEVQQGRFGASTRMINGGLECRGQNYDKSKGRYNIYVNVFRALNPPGHPIEGGCYS